jgi:signal transduction histidine kinase
MTDDTVLAALRRHRRRFPISSWPLRSFAYLITSLPVAAPPVLGATLLVALAAPVAYQLSRGDLPHLFALVGVALAVSLAVLAPLAALPLAALERRRLALVDDRPARSGHRPTPRDLIAWLRVRYAEPATWRAVAYALFLATVVPVVYGCLWLLLIVEAACLIGPLVVLDGAEQVQFGPAEVSTLGEAVPLALLALAVLPLLPYALGLTAGAHAAVARALLHDGDATALREVARSRARLVDAFEAERRRIERDLHDGAQHRLTSLTLQLGVAMVDVPANSPAARPLALAHRQAKDLMVELRELIYGIHPQTLTDLGLPAAVRELAARSRTRVQVTSTLPDGPAGRLPTRVESAAYFVVSEALGNVTRHSGAGRAEVRLAVQGRLLAVEVRDDGRGGADPGRGTGLTGLADRAAALGGRLLLSSPAGGPTLLRVELPCAG